VQVLLLTLSLLAQARDSSSRAISFGYFATLGANWQIEAVELGYVVRRPRGLAAISLATRIGAFLEQSTYLGGTRGAVLAAVVSTRTRLIEVSQLGSEQRPKPIGIDFTIEVAGYVAAGSQFWQGSRWVALSFVPAFRMGPASLAIGPSALLGGHKPAMRGVLALRGEASLRRR
jgi:hypothetical protein